MVLLVEDDEAVRDRVREALEEQGCGVIEAERGDDALRLAEQEIGPIHLLVTGLDIPGTGAEELASRLSAVRPSLKVLYLSGPADELAMSYRVSGVGAPFVERPFSPQALGGAVRRLLNGDGDV